MSNRSNVAVDLTKESSSSTEVGQQKTGIFKKESRIPRSIWILSISSMLITLASSMAVTLAPIYMVNVLQISKLKIGFIEGFVEFLALTMRFFSGVFSDLLLSRKTLIGGGFIFMSFAKMLTAFATTSLTFFMAKAMDKIGNGVQAAPRDALIGDLSPSTRRGESFGLAQSLRKWGSTIGAIVVYIFLMVKAHSYKEIFLSASAFSCLGVVFFYSFVKEKKSDKHKSSRERFSFQQFVNNSLSMPKAFWSVIGVTTLYSLGHFNESFLEMRALDVGLQEHNATLIIVVLCFMVFLTAYPLGRLSDVLGRKKLFIFGLFAMVCANLCLAYGTTIGSIFLATALWGVHWAVTQGLLLSIVVDASPKDKKGTAFGVFYLTMGVATLLANVLAGFVWDKVGGAYTFLLSGSIAVLSIIYCLFIKMKPYQEN